MLKNTCIELLIFRADHVLIVSQSEVFYVVYLYLMANPYYAIFPYFLFDDFVIVYYS